MKKVVADIAKELLHRKAELAQIISLQLAHGAKPYAELLDIAIKANFTEDEFIASMMFLIQESRVNKKNNKWELIR